MEFSKVPISVRIARMNNLFLGRVSCGTSITKKHFVGREGLLDALIVLYDECNNDAMKRDKYVALFVEKFRSIITELRSLRVNISDFEVKKVIGRGHFGQVQVVREKQTGNVYAMKTLRKSDTLNQTAFYEEERDIMAFCSSPWLTSLQYAFQDMYNLYLVMEFHPGGDLQALLDRFDGVLDEDMTRFYLAELILAVSSLHAMGYVHRDVKPENILLDRCGHLKLADFGSAAKLSAAGMVFSSMPVGTPEYVAPEVLEAMETFCVKGNNKKSHGSYGMECDYWSLGIIAYEMVVGSTPFSGNQLAETYSRIMNHKSHLEIPAGHSTSQAFGDLVNGLLTDAATRLTHEKLMKHPFFTSINWNTLRNSVPPYLPVVNGVDDTSNFMEFESEPPTPSIEYFKTKKEFSGRNLPFVGFTYSPSMDTARTEEKGEPSQLEEVVILQKKEIDTLKQQLTNALESVKMRKDANTIQRQLDERTAELARAQEDLRKLEYDLDQCRKCEMSLKRTLTEERKERQIQESKALALVQNTKAQWVKKHKEEIADLKEKLENQKDHITMVCTKNNELSSKVERQEEQLKYACTEITMLQHMLKQSKSRVEEVRETSRQSIVGAECMLEQLAMNSNSQLTNLQAQLADESMLRLKLQDQIRELSASAAKKDAELQQSKVEKSNLASELDVFRKKCEDLEKQIQDIEKEQELAVNDHIAELQQQLRRERQECSNLRVRLNTIENKLSESVRSLEFANLQIANREVETEDMVAILESELKKAAEEKIRLQQRLQQVSEREEEENRKVEKLEGLLKRLQDGVSCLEQENQRLKEQKGTEAENEIRQVELDQQRAILVAQVEKLEAQLEKVREVSILDRQAAKTTQEKLWKKEKELADAQIDLRIARREMKTLEDQLTLVTNEKYKVEAEKSDIIDDLHSQLDTMKQRIATFESNLEAAKSQEDALRKQVNAEKALVSEKTLAFDSIKTQMQNLQHQLEVSERQVKLMNQQAEEFQSLNKTLIILREDKLKLEAQVEELKRNICGLDMDYNCLKEVVTVFDEQLEEYMILLDTYKTKELCWGKEKEEMDKRILSLEDDIKQAHLATNEEKSLRIRVELKLQSLEMDAETQAAHVTALQREVEHYKSLSEQRTQEVAVLEEQASKLMLDLRNARCQIEKLDGECNALKEECSSLLTQIYSLKESNLQLSSDLQSSDENNKQLKSKYEELKASFTEMEQFYKLGETKSEATLQQQSKLIEFLQTLLQEGNKKKSLKNKIFGSKQKENIPPTRERRPLQQCTSAKPVMHEQASIPPSKTAISHLMQSPGSTLPGVLYRQPSLRRMHHNIPHRFEQKLCKKVCKCAACQEALHFGRHMSFCQDCHITVHKRCISSVPTNCGLPTALVQHFSESWNANKDAEESNEKITSDSMEGFIKIPRRQGCWERKYAKLDGIKLLIYDEKPVSENIAISTFLLCCAEGNTRVVSSVCAADVANTAISDLPYIIKIDIVPKTTCWPGSSVLIMTLSSNDKQAWLAALEAAVEQYKGSHPQDSNQYTDRYKGKILLSMKENEALDLNCVLQLNSEVLLLGAEEGLYSLKLQVAQAKPLRIEGTTQVHQIVILPFIQMALLLTGSDRSLMECDLRQLKNSAMTIECAEPSITLQHVLKDVVGILIFGASTTMDQHQEARTIICAASEKQIVLLSWNVFQSSFLPIRYLETNAPCGCIHFSRYSIIVGCDKFFEIELNNFCIEEFLDPNDSSLHHIVKGAGAIQNYPISILDVAKARNSEPEYLVCFHDVGVFVDKYGQRSRSEDIKWSHVPVSIVYRKPYLFIVHFCSVEVMKLTDTSFTEESNSSLCSPNLPENIFIEMSNPKYLGVAEGMGPAVYVGSANSHLFVVEGALAVSDNSALDWSNDTDKDGADLNGGGSLEFSFTSSLEDDLEDETKRVHFKEN